MNDFFKGTVTPQDTDVSVEMTDLMTEKVPEYAKLWALRMLVQLGGTKDFLSEHYFNHPWIAIELGFSEHFTNNGYNKAQAHQELRQIYQRMENNFKDQDIIFPDGMRHNLQLLQQLLHLDELECLILGFVVTLQSEQLLDDIADTLGSLTASKALRVLSIVLQKPYDDIRIALSAHGRLHSSGLLQIEKSYSSVLRNKVNLVSNELVDKLQVKATHPIDLFAGTINQSAAAELTLGDYPHLAAPLNVLIHYLQHVKTKRSTGVNIFLYGSSGTGKTQLCKVVAEKLGLSLYEISCEDSDGDSITATARLCAFRAAQSIFDGHSALLLFDEVEDVFNDNENGAGMKSTAQSRKAWVNQMLEKNRTPTVWISNSDDVDPAFIRRFDMVLEVKVPPKKQRKQLILQHCNEGLSAAYQDALANVEQLSPAVLRRAYRVSKQAKLQNADIALEASMTSLIGSTLKAQGYGNLRLKDSNALPDFYDVDFIQTKANVKEIAQGIKTFGFGRLCLYGPSGTGKTAFARWLAEFTDKPLLIKRGSDLQSPYVGEMEQNLAKAFAQAEELNAILLLDEVDSLLQDRKYAVRSWEISQVNEFLVQMESYNGILITTTNRFTDLDQAALRRFDFKIHFDYLNYAQRLRLFTAVCQQLNLDFDEASIQAQLQQLSLLCAGDFAVIVRQACFHPFADAQAVLEHLKQETLLKEVSHQPIGFLQKG